MKRYIPAVLVLGILIGLTIIGIANYEIPKTTTKVMPTPSPTARPEAETVDAPTVSPSAKPVEPERPVEKPVETQWTNPTQKTSEAVRINSRKPEAPSKVPSKPAKTASPAIKTPESKPKPEKPDVIIVDGEEAPNEGPREEPTESEPVEATPSEATPSESPSDVPTMPTPTVPSEEPQMPSEKPSTVE